MSRKLTIRNLSNVPLTLTSVERFGPNDVNTTAVSNMTSIFAMTTNSLGLTNSTTRAAVCQLEQNARPLTTQDVSIRIGPFDLVQTGLLALEDSNKERFRLSFEADDGLHQMLCPVPTQESADLVAPPNARRSFTGIYLAHSAFVALYSSSRLDSWMSQLQGHLPLSLLSIPGTHNSPTHYLAPPSVRCQAVSPQEQLENGVRFFDLRVRPETPTGDKLALVHSVFPVSLSGKKYFHDLYNMVLEFLKKNPGETLVMSLKREGAGNATDQQLSKILKTHYIDRDRDHWYTEPQVPSLDQARGKIVLIRRFHLDKDSQRSDHTSGRDLGLGIDASSWADNATDSLCPSGDIRLQDFYEVAESQHIDKKIEYCTAHLYRSGCCVYQHPNDPSPPPHQKTPIHINFLSASNFWKVGTWPEKIAARVNPACVDWLCRQHMVMKRKKAIVDDDGEPPSSSSQLQSRNVENDDVDVDVGDDDEGVYHSWSTGVVVCDWVGLDGDWDLVRCVVGMNARLTR